jgi:hypothetical protein
VVDERRLSSRSSGCGIWARRQALTGKRASDVSGLDGHQEPQRSPRGPALTTSVMLHVRRRSLRNRMGQDGTTWDAAGYLLLSIPAGYEVKARFC